MKTLREIIHLRQKKYNESLRNPSISEFWNGYYNGWFNAYQDLKEILVQNGFNLDVPVIDVGKTNADRIRSMTDEELAAVLDGFGAYSVCEIVCGGKCYAIASLEKTASQKCREIILAKLQEPYKEKENGQTIGVDTEA